MASQRNHQIFFFMVSLFLILSSSCCCHASATEEEEADRITNLPGQPKANFQQFAGYVTVNEAAGRALFYWLTEATHHPQNKPLVLWLNGGPGCSSIAYGATQEIGPFLIRTNSTKLISNDYSWNKVANILFLESPMGVGFSYSNTSEDYNNIGDQLTAMDSYTFLAGWFKKFPRFQSHDFYIAGENYAGHYAPQLAELIYDKNKGAGNDSFINLKGILIGNPVINDKTDRKGFIDYAWSHAIISNQLYHVMLRDCFFGESLSRTNCNNHYSRYEEAISVIDTYGIDSPMCLTSFNRDPQNPLINHTFWVRPQYPCLVENVVKYFNREDVQRALHANVTKLSYPYASCRGLMMNWKDLADSVLPIMRKLLDAGLPIWIYSGDTDVRVPTTSTRYSVKEMGLKLKEKWRAWYYKHQVAGWVESYEEGLTLATVHGAGHQVPVFAPQQSLMLFSHFLNATALARVGMHSDNAMSWAEAPDFLSDVMFADN